MTFENDIALVTGASRGIGRAIAEELGCSGVTVIGTATTEKGAQDISQYLQQAGIRGKGVHLNVVDVQAIDQVIEKIVLEFGAPSILVNNAGITRDNLMMRMKDEEWDQVIATNLTAIFHLSRACLRPMVKARYGRIVSISSVVGATGNPGQANYAAAKAGVIGFSKALAREVAARQITVNVVAPGFIDTDMTRGLADEHKQKLLQNIPAARLGTSKEIALVVKFLASRDAAYMTGQTLHVNGGMHMN